MAPRDKSKAKRPVAAAAAETSALLEKVDRIERERDALAAELAAARAQVADLELRRHEAVNRIDRLIGRLGQLVADDV